MKKFFTLALTAVIALSMLTACGSKKDDAADDTQNTEDADKAAADNVASGITAENANAVINIEQVYEWNPDAVFVTNFTAAKPDDLTSGKYHDWSSVKAVQDDAVYKMPLGLYRSYTPSADSPLTLLWLAKTLYPARFADIDMAKETSNYYKALFGVTLTEIDAQALFPTRADGKQ